MQIWKYTSIHVEKYECEKCKRVCKESKYIYMKKVTFSGNVNKETDKIKKKYIRIANM